MPTTQDFYNEIMVEKQAQTALNDLTTVNNAQDLLTQVTTTSKAAEHDLWAFITAKAMATLYSFFNLFKSDVAELLEAKEPGTDGWYRNMMFLFQFNYQLMWNGKKFVYNDTTSALAIASKVIKYCAVNGNYGKVVVKVAGESSGLPTQLTALQAAAALAYLKKIRFAGSKVQLFALPADTLKILGNVYFDPLLTQAVVKANVEAAIVEFNKLFPFNGLYNINKLIDAVQAVPGVIDFTITNVYYKYAGNPYVAINREYNPVAGYVKIDTATGNTLNDTLTYTAAA